MCMIETAAALIDSESLITAAGTWGLALVCAIVFVETGLLVGFLLPGDTLLLVTGVLVFSGVIQQPIWLVCLCIFVSAFLGDQVGYLIGYRGGPTVFERREKGLISRATVAQTERFFERWGGWAVTFARFIAFVRTFSPVAAGIGKMRYRTFVLFSVLGSLAWGAGLTLAGWGFAHLPGIHRPGTDRRHQPGRDHPGDPFNAPATQGQGCCGRGTRLGRSVRPAAQLCCSGELDRLAT
jgi:membrane-associated protein